MIRPLWEVEKVYIQYVLELCNQNRTHAARALGISLRTIRNKIKQYSDNPNGPPRPFKIVGLK